MKISWLAGYVSKALLRLIGQAWISCTEQIVIQNWSPDPLSLEKLKDVANCETRHSTQSDQHCKSCIFAGHYVPIVPVMPCAVILTVHAQAHAI